MRLHHFLKTLFFFLLISTSSYLAATLNTVIATVDAGSAPAFVAITPNGATAYVANQNEFVKGMVTVIDIGSNTVIATVIVGTQPFSTVISPDGQTAYVASSNSGVVSVIDTPSNTVIATIAIGSASQGMAITPDGTAVYVTNLSSANVSVIDSDPSSINYNTIIATVSVGNSPIGVAITPDGTKAYVTNDASGTVSIIDTASYAVTTVTVGSGPINLAITPDGTRVYVNNNGGSTVSVINTSSLVVTSVNVGSGPSGIAITPDGILVYVANEDDGTVSVINTLTNLVIAIITVGNDPVSIAITPNGQAAYVTNDYMDNRVSVIDTASNVVIATLTVGSGPSFVAITPNGQAAYVTNSQDNTVSVIDTALFVPCPNNNILFVNNSCTSDGDGSYAMPFNNLTEALFQNCDVIYVFPGNGPYDAKNATGFVLKPNQRLLGTSTQAFQFCSNCAKPTLENTGGGPVVALSSNNEVSGFIINPSTNQHGISSGIDRINALITNNVITTIGRASCIFFRGCPLVGDVTISDCQFFASGMNQISHGIFVQQCGNGNFTVQNNNFGALNNPTGFENGFVMQILTGACTVALNNNIFSIQNSNSGTSNVLLNPSSVFPLTARLFRNTLQLFSSGTPSGGIVTTVSASGTAYLSLVENSVSTPSSIPGYSLINNSFQGAFQCFDLFNLGSIDTSTTMFPITYVPTEG